jgi:hypothetical protein
VTVAGYLLYLVAALQLIALVVQVSQVGTIADATENAYRGTDAENTARVSTIVGTLVAAIIGGLFAIAYIVLAIFNNRGKNASRIVTWVLGGIGVCCGALGLVGAAASNSFNFNRSDRNLPDPADVQRQINDALPSWYRPVTITLGVVALLAVLAVIILLALPPSNEFFRKPQQVWQPPEYPQGGGYPPPGGYQQPGGYPTPGSYYPPPTPPPAPGIPPAPPPPGAAPQGPPPGAAPQGGMPPQGEMPPGAPSSGGPPPPGGPPA